MIEAVGRRSLGLAVDTFHLYVGGSAAADLAACPARALALVRLADAPSGEREGLRAHHRLLPGDGVAPIRAVLGIVRTLGAEVPLVVDVPVAEGTGDAAGWMRRLRERALSLTRGPHLAPSV